MSELRRRNIADSTPAQRRTQLETNSDVTQISSLPSASVALKTVLIFLSLSASTFFWFYTQVPPASVNCYAICSRSGARIYTVDDANNIVQCLVIQDELIVDIGSLGALSSSNFHIWTNSSIPDDISVRWRAANNSGSTLRIRYINDQSIVVPGLSGQSSASLDNT